MSMYHHLSAADREKIAAYKENDRSVRDIARELGRSASTISRELRRNRSVRDGYVAEIAIQKSVRRRTQSQPRILKNEDAKAYVLEKLALCWTPAEISGRMRLDRLPFYACPETIYKFIYQTPEGRTLKRYKNLKRRQKNRYYRHSKRAHEPRLPKGLSIHNRPPIVSTRLEPGHFEGDLVIGKNGKITTLVERVTRKAFAIKNDSKHTAVIMAGIRQKLTTLPPKLRRSLTVDQGTEFAAHADFSQNTDIPIYFCDTHSPWQKGANENFNGRLRFFFPKASDFKHLSQHHLDQRIDQMNNTPRKCLGYLTPNEAFSSLL